MYLWINKRGYYGENKVMHRNIYAQQHSIDPTELLPSLINIRM